MDANDSMTEPPVMSPPSELNDPGAPSSWPTTLGVICIVFGGLGLACYGCGSVQTALGPWMAGMVPEEQRPATPQGLQLVVQVAQMCTAFALSVWLLVAGIGLTRRRPWSRAHCMGWSVVKILLVVVGTVAGALFAPDSVQQVNDQLSQGGRQTPPFTMTTQIIYIILLISLLWFLVWPVVLLLWFSRASVKAEVEAWAAESRAMI